MGVRIQQSKTFTTPIVFTIKDENGKPEKQTFDAVFKRLSREEVKTLLESTKGDGENPGRSDVELVSEVLVGWKLTDPDTKNDVPFSEEMLAALLSLAGVGGVIMMTFLETVGASRTKN